MATIFGYTDFSMMGIKYKNLNRWREKKTFNIFANNKTLYFQNSFLASSCQPGIQPRTRIPEAGNYGGHGVGGRRGGEK